MADEATETQQASQQAQAQAADASLLDDIVEATKLKPSDEAFSTTKQGLQAFLEELVKPERAGARISGALVDDMISQLDQKLSSQVNEILHNQEFRKVESSWRSLKYLVMHTDFRENIRLQFVNVNKEDLLSDFEDAPEVVKSGLYKQVYTSEYGQFGGQPLRGHGGQLRIRARAPRT